MGLCHANKKVLLVLIVLSSSIALVKRHRENLLAALRSLP